MSSEQIMDFIIQSGLLGVLVGLLVSVIKYAKTFLDNKTNETLSKINDENIKNAIFITQDLVSTVVLELSQTMADEMKKKTADGKLSAEDVKTLKSVAIERIEKLMSEKVYSTINEVFGNVENWLNEKIESEVRKSKTNLLK